MTGMRFRAVCAVVLFCLLLAPQASGSEPPERFEAIGRVVTVRDGSVVLKDVSFASGAAVGPAADGRLEVLTPRPMPVAHPSGLGMSVDDDGTLLRGHIVYIAGRALPAALGEPVLAADRAMTGDLSQRPDWHISRVVISAEEEGTATASARGELNADLTFAGTCRRTGPEYAVEGTWAASDPSGTPMFVGTYTGQDARAGVYNGGYYNLVPRVSAGTGAYRALAISSEGGSGLLLLQAAGSCADAGAGSAHFFLPS
jgi:hypothetical protein